MYAININEIGYMFHITSQKEVIFEMKRKDFLLPGIALLISISGCQAEEKASDSLDFVSDKRSETASENNESTSSLTESESGDLTVTEKKEYVQTSFINPLYTSGEFADPSGVYCDEENAYYLYGTGGKILKSTDMVNWRPRMNAFNAIPTWGTAGAGLWAPDVQYIDGQYVMYYSLSTWGDPNPGIGIATASHPSGPWIDHGKLFSSEEIGVNNSIDPMGYVDRDGKVYLVWGSMRGNFIVELTKDGLALKNGLTYAKENKIRVAGNETDVAWDVRTYEGAFIIYEKGYYYLFLSMGTCCEGLNSSYRVVVGRSRSVTGPYLDHELKDMKLPDAGKVVIDKGDYFVGSGHNCILQDQEGNYFIYYHTYSQDHQEFRVLAMDHLYFDEEGWPCVADNKASVSEQEGPVTYRYVMTALK